MFVYLCAAGDEYGDGGVGGGMNGGLSSPLKLEFLTVQITKGAMGFGFTIADSAYGQKVKTILDRPRCKNLQEGDILVDINGINMRVMSHSEVVQVRLRFVSLFLSWFTSAVAIAMVAAILWNVYVDAKKNTGDSSMRLVCNRTFGSFSGTERLPVGSRGVHHCPARRSSDAHEKQMEERGRQGRIGPSTTGQPA